MYDALEKIDSFKNLKEELRETAAPLSVNGIFGSAANMLVNRLASDYKRTLYIATDEKAAIDIREDLLSLGANAHIYPAKDLLFGMAGSRTNNIATKRMSLIKSIVEDERIICIAPINALMDKQKPLENIVKEKITVSLAQNLDISSFSKSLSFMGYERVIDIETMGEFAIRGGIIDIYPVSAAEPVRIELFGDEVDSIRTFNVGTKRSIENISEVVIYPAKTDTEEDKTEIEVSFLDYFDENDLIILDNPKQAKDRALFTETECLESFEKRKEEKLSAELNIEDFFGTEVLFEKLKNKAKLLLTPLDDSLKEYGAIKNYTIKTLAVGRYSKNINILVKDLNAYAAKSYRISLITPSKVRAHRLSEELRNMGLRAYIPDENVVSNELAPGEIEVVRGNLREGFIYPDIKYMLLTESELFGNKQKQKKYKSDASGERLGSLAELKIGDYVVHENHGIGVYRGIEHIEDEGVKKDYIRVEYGDGSLLIPVTKLNLLVKYMGAEGESLRPRLSRLNNRDWVKTKKAASIAAGNMAKELTKLYAARLNGKGFRYSDDTLMQKEFEETFPFEETSDQLSAIEKVKADMESDKIMDRLICGDVGYGKTEVALRAAFKAVGDSKQVAFLAPTTILCKQHFNTFTKRLKGFPVRVAMLSRFRSEAENKKTEEDIREGKVDIVIGTHRLLSKGVKFKDLGLLVIDEEQRFGVKHKEKIKELKENVDVLTLTATPIPRTLHMSLSGIRDLSILEEPPFDRVPIETYVMEYNEELVREAINREIRRGGQVFYIYNRVSDIADKCDALRKLLPGVRISYAHGQMDEGELEDVMSDFVAGDIDVLCSTTIVETGLDIPNANTLIVDGADKMGLSGLYQLRGRVGRSNRMAYAFLMYRKDKIMSEVAEKRLRAIKEFTEFGSGIKIAMRDLEIRGAGNVLGAEQHGQMMAVGYDLYCKMLGRAVDSIKKGEEPKEYEFETTIDIDEDAYIPDTYISDEHSKLDAYKRISDITNSEEKEDVIDELIDRFGDLPPEVLLLLDVVILKKKAHECYVTELNIKRSGFIMCMDKNADVKVDKIPELINEEKGRLKFMGGTKPKFIYKLGGLDKESTRKVMEKAEKILEILKR